MFFVDDLEALIRQHVILGKPSRKGYHAVKCQVCNDHRERGGFKFENGGVHFACFNCSCSASFKGGSSYLSKDMERVLAAFSIPYESFKDGLSANAFLRRKAELEGKILPQGKTTEQKKLAFPEEISLPKNSVLITESEDWGVVAQEYLKLRKLDQEQTPFFVSTTEAYLGRLIIPYYFRGKLIYWQGRAMDDTIKPRYKNPYVDKSNVFYNMDEVYRYTTDPLFVAEGSIDALSVGKNGVALLGSDLTEFQLDALKKIKNRRIIFLIDKNQNGFKLAQRALANGWEVVCFPGDISDANDALKQLGKLWLLNHLVSSARGGFAGKLMVKMMCNTR